MNKLKTYLYEHHQQIRSVLKSVDIDFTIGERPVETFLIYLPCKNGTCDHSELFEIIKDVIMHQFVFTYTEIEKKLSVKTKDSTAELFEKAVRKISAHTAQGELGELLLFTLLEVYFDAPKILSKISMKTNKKMPVYGADAVHAQFVNSSLRLYLGESKLHANFSNASSKAVSSITNALDKYEEEYDLIESYINFPDMDADTREKVLELLDPFSEMNENIEPYLHSPCFIGFVAKEIFHDDENTYKANYLQLAEKLVGTFYSNLEKSGNNINKTALMLLPFTSLENMVEEFIDYMGIK